MNRTLSCVPQRFAVSSIQLLRFVVSDLKKESKGLYKRVGFEECIER